MRWALSILALGTILSCRSLTPEQELRLTNLIERLGSDSIEAREKASHEIVALGPLALPALRRELETAADPEVRERLEEAIAKLEAGKRVDWVASYAFRVYVADERRRGDCLARCIDLECPAEDFIELADVPQIEVTEAKDEQGHPVTLTPTGPQPRPNGFVISGCAERFRSLEVIRGYVSCKFPLSSREYATDDPLNAGAVNFAGFQATFRIEQEGEFVLRFRSGTTDLLRTIYRRLDPKSVVIIDSEGRRRRGLGFGWHFVVITPSSMPQLVADPDPEPGEDLIIVVPGLRKGAVRSLSFRFVDRTFERRFPFEIRDVRLWCSGN